jgi:hypothetical protein
VTAPTSQAAAARSRARLARVSTTVTLLGLVTTLVIAWTSATRSADVPTESAEFELAFTAPSMDDAYIPPTLQLDWGLAWTRVRVTSMQVMRPLGPLGKPRNEWVRQFTELNESLRSKKPLGALSPGWAYADANRTANYVPDYGHPASAEIRGYGWPARALSSTVDWTHPSVPLRHACVLEFASLAEALDLGFSTIVLPLRPYFPGLLLDTTLFSTLWFLVLFAPRSIRRNRRLRHGLCPLCAYDLQGQPSPGCPECGWNRAAGSPA